MSKRAPQNRVNCRFRCWEGGWENKNNKGSMVEGDQEGRREVEINEQQGSRWRGARKMGGRGTASIRT